MRIVNILAVVGAALLCGCTTVCKSTGGMEIVHSEGSAAAVSYDDNCFVEYLKLESSALARTAGGQLKAQLEIRNVYRDDDWKAAEHDFTAQYRVMWYDQGGLAVAPDRAYWQRVTWHGGESLPITDLAPDTSAVKCVVRLRHVR